MPEISVSYLVGDYGQEVREMVGRITLHRIFRGRDSLPIAITKLLIGMYRAGADVYVLRAAHAGVLLSLIIARLLGRRVVYMVAHDMEGAPRELARHTGRLTAWAMSLVYRYADAVTFQTEGQAALFVGKCRGRTAVVRNLYVLQNPLAEERGAQPQTQRSSFSEAPTTPVESLKSEEICARGEHQSGPYIGYGERGMEPQTQRSSFSEAPLLSVESLKSDEICARGEHRNDTY